MQQIVQKIKGDKVIWSTVILLSLLSLLAVYSATGSLAWRMDKSSSYYLTKQLMILGVGLFIIFMVHRINYTKFARFSVLLFLISIPLLLYTLFFGTKLNEGSRWITIPVINQTFQTSDLARLAIFMFLARQLSVKQKVIKDLRKGFLPVLFPVLIICGLIAPANLSTALLLGLTCCILFFIGRVDIKHITLLAIMGIVGVALIFSLSLAFGIGRGATWQKRIDNFMGNAKADDKDADSNYQITQAQIAIASGGLTGRGPGKSWARDFLPHPYSDFIFAIIIEEYGIIGATLLIGVYLLFLWRSILIFRRCPYAFGAFLAVGLSFTLVFQALMNMAVNVHLVPVTGLTLPLVSMGGSSIWFNCVAIGIILSVSRYVDEMEGQSALKASKNL
jgi:cell division protein FtsW